MVMMKTNKLFDYSDFSDIDFVKVQKEIGEFGSDSRKSWEFVTITYGLKPFFSNDKVALGLGCLKGPGLEGEEIQAVLPHGS